jgi:hypothetical protein
MAQATTHFDIETISLLKKSLDDAWDCLPAERRATVPKSSLAGRIIKSAAEGERDPERLVDAALKDA